MCRGGALRALCVAVAVMACGAGRALAQSSAIDPLPPDDLSGGSQPEHFLLFSGVDIWRFGFTGYSGIQWAPNTLNNDGFIVRLFLSEGFERYTTPNQRFDTTIFRSSLLPGWRFKRGNFEVRIFAGPALENQIPTPDIPGVKLRGTHFGAHTAAELWWEPTPSIMLASSFSATTIGTEYSARGAAGWRLFDSFWAGPEISASGDEFSKQYRVGAHLTGFRTAAVEWSVAAGFVEDSFNRSGVYGRIGVLTRQ